MINFESYESGVFTFSVRQRDALGLASGLRSVSFGYFPDSSPPPGEEIIPPADDDLDPFLDSAEALLGADYGGAWIDYEADGDIVASIGVVNLTPQDTVDLNSLLPPDISVDPHDVTYSYDELDQFAETIDAAAGDNVMAIAVVPQLNKVEVTYAPSSPGASCESCVDETWGVPTNAIIEAPPAIPEVVLESGTRWSYPPYKAGKGIRVGNDKTPCSAGFEMKMFRPDGPPRVQGSTAHHCGHEGGKVIEADEPPRRRVIPPPDDKDQVIGHMRRGGDAYDFHVKLDAILFGIGQNESTGRIYVKYHLSRRVVGKLSGRRIDHAGKIVCKSGANTENTCGGMYRTFTRLKVDKDGDGEDDSRYYNVGCAKYESAKGDSGAAVYRRLGEERARAVGLHWGTVDIGGPDYACFEPIMQVEAVTNSEVVTVN